MVMLTMARLMARPVQLLRQRDSLSTDRTRSG